MLVLLSEVGAGQVIELAARVLDVGGADVEVDADGAAVVVGGGGLETHFDRGYEFAMWRYMRLRCCEICLLFGGVWRKMFARGRTLRKIWF